MTEKPKIADVGQEAGKIKSTDEAPKVNREGVGLLETSQVGAQREPLKELSSDHMARAAKTEKMTLHGDVAEKYDGAKTRELMLKVLKELPDGKKLADKAARSGQELKHTVAELPYEQFQIFAEKFKQFNAGKPLTVQALDTIADLSPADQMMLDEIKKGTLQPSFPDDGMAYAIQVGRVISLEKQAAHDRNLLEKLTHPSPSKEDLMELALYGLHHNRPDITKGTLNKAPELTPEVKIHEIVASVLHAAEHKHVGIRFASLEKIQSILESLPKEQIQAAEELCKKTKGHTLSEEVKSLVNSGMYGKLMGGKQFELVGRYFDRKGDSDEAGQIRAALENLDRNYLGVLGRQKGPSRRAEMDILKSVGVMSSEQLTGLKDELKQSAGIDLDKLPDHKRLSASASGVLKILSAKGINERGYDEVNAMVDLAKQDKRLDIFEITMRLASPEVRDRIRKERADELVKAFTEDKYFPAFYKKSVEDYIKTGNLSLKTLVDGDTSSIIDALSNIKEINRLVNSASKEEKLRYKTDPDYKRELDKTFERASRVRNIDASIWKSQMRDDENLTGQMLHVKRFLRFTPARGDWSPVLDNLDKKSFDFFRSNPAALQRFDKDLSDLYNVSARKEIMSRLLDKLGFDSSGSIDFSKIKAFSPEAPRKEVLDQLGLKEREGFSYPDSAERGRLPIGVQLKDARNDKEKIQVLNQLALKEVERISTNNRGARTEIEAALRSQFASPAGQEYAKHWLERISKGENGRLDSIEVVALSALVPDKPIESIHAIELAFKEHPELLQKFYSIPVAADVAAQKAVFEQSLTRALAKVGITGKDSEGTQVFDPLKVYGEILRSGRMPLSQKLDLVSGMEAKRQLVISDANEAERKALLSVNPSPEEKKLQDSVLGAKDQRELSRYVIAQGGYSPADIVRSYILGDKETKLGQWVDGFFSHSAREVVDMLKSLPRETVTLVADEYFRKYGTLMSQDVLSKASPADRLQLREALSEFELNMQQRVLMSRQEHDGSAGARPFEYLSRMIDYSGPGARESNETLLSLLTDKSRELAKIDPDLAMEFEKAVKSYVEAEQHSAEAKRVLWALACPVQLGGWTALAWAAGKYLPAFWAVVGSKFLGKMQAVGTLAINQAILGPKQYTATDAMADLVVFPFASIKLTYWELAKRGLGHVVSPGARVASEVGSTAAAAVVASAILN